MLFKLDLDQISFNHVENALATQQLAFLATSIAFHHFVTRACAEIKIFRLFFSLPFFSFSFLFAAGIDLLLGLLAAWIIKRLAVVL